MFPNTHPQSVTHSRWVSGDDWGNKQSFLPLIYPIRPPPTLQAIRKKLIANSYPLLATKRQPFRAARDEDRLAGMKIAVQQFHRQRVL